MKLYCATVKADNVESVKNLNLALLTNTKNRRIEIIDGIATITIEDKQLNPEILAAIAECGIITAKYDGFECTEPAEISDEAEAKTAETGEDEETEQPDNLEETVEMITEEAKVPTTSKEDRKDFNIYTFPDLKEIIDGAKTDEDLAEKLSKFFNLGAKKESFRKVFMASLKITDNSWENIEKYLGEEFIPYERNYTSRKVNKFFEEKYGYKLKARSLMKVIRLIKDYYMSIPKKETKIQCMPWLDLSDMDPKAEGLKKVHFVFSKIDKEGKLNIEELSAIYLLISVANVTEDTVKVMGAENEMKISTVINDYAKAYTKEHIKVWEFLRDLKAIL